MNAISAKIAEVIKAIANLGAGAASSGVAYEPKMPKKLKK
ncbi:MAG: cyclic lactone autoinducer peptide [Oscillospiraceae bacterium]|nr:cyclic lactone autoinducer peptide [Oscillospiraceae bacterium]